nr:MAG TPA: hypothetical protein [Caudoviricetes sp.]
MYLTLLRQQSGKQAVFTVGAGIFHLCFLPCAELDATADTVNKIVLSIRPPCT